ncbi:MAG: endonuclease/exonuclease/phosphatase family protein [Opitutales bacterium]|jgi:endonuclease/exonuclease/phosphatase family metal-dependent hydrolase
MSSMSFRILFFAFWSLPLGAEQIRVAAFNLRNYLVCDRSVEGIWRQEYPKPEKEKAAIRSILSKIRPDVIALQEIGPEPFLLELQKDLQTEGIDYPHRVWMEAEDEVRHLAVLSRKPIVATRRHDALDFKYFDGREKIRRGLLEVVFETDGVKWSLFVVHLKSKWTERKDDFEAAKRRTGEARAARDHIRHAFPPEKSPLYLVTGDFNDHRDSAPLRRFLQCGDAKLTSIAPAMDSRGEVWTHYWAKRDLYSRVDFMLATPPMMKRIKEGRGKVVDLPEASIASDHRMVYFDLEFAGPPEKEK